MMMMGNNEVVFNIVARARLGSAPISATSKHILHGYLERKRDPNAPLHISYSESTTVARNASWNIKYLENLLPSIDG